MKTELPEERRKRERRLALLLCFAVPAAVMALLYTSIGVWPGSKNSVLVLDLNAQYIYYFEEFREIILSGDSILYSFKRALGGEFMGIFAYYLASPFSLIVALFPKENILDAMELILVLKCGFTGLAFGYFITEKLPLRPAPAVMFSSLYALTSFAVVMQHNVMWTDNLIAFPLILAGLDALIRRRKFRLYVLSLAYAAASNFYIGYMACLFVLVWFFVRYFMLAPEERNPLGESSHFVKSLLRVALWSAAGVSMAGVILLPTVYSLSFGKLEFSTPDWSPKQLFEFLDILTKSFFGSYDTVRPEGMPFLYCGTEVLVLSPLYFLTRSVPLRRKIGFGFMLAFLFVSFNFGPLDIVWHGMQRPNWLNARFAYMFTALLIWMAAETFVRLPEIGGRALAVTSVGWAALLLVCSKIGYENLPAFKSVWPGLLCFCLIPALLTPFAVREKKKEPLPASGPEPEPEQDPAEAVQPEEAGTLEDVPNPEIHTEGTASAQLPEDAPEPIPIPDDKPESPVKPKPGSAPRQFPRFLRTARPAAVILCCAVLTELYANGLIMMLALDADVSYSSRHSYRQMIDTYEPAVDLIKEVDDGTFFRFEKLAHRKKNDNFALDIRGMSNSTSTLNARAVDLLAQFGYAAQSHWSMYAGASAVTDALFDIRYVMTDETDDKPIMSYIYDLYDPIGSTDTHIDVYENPYALSLAYAVDPDTASFDDPDEDEDKDDYVDPFTYMNRLLSVMTGEEVAVWRRAELLGTDYTGCDQIFATGHRGYEKSGSGGASVIYTVQIDSAQPLYCYFPSAWPREASLMLNGSKIGKYFDGQDFSLRELGQFSPGEIINVSLVLKKDALYIRSGVACFWYFDEAAFRETVEKLKPGVMNAVCDFDEEIKGTVTIPEGRELLFTTIPYDEGWKVTVDGQKTAAVSVLKDALLAVRIPAGEHKIAFTYDPLCVKAGWALTCAGLCVFALGTLFYPFVPMNRKRKKTDD